MSTYYDILRVPEDADDKEIKAAYRQAALAYHPDHMPKGVSKRMRDDAAEAWLEIQEAFAVLSDLAKREEYDTLLEEMRQAEEVERQFEPATTPPAPRGPKAAPTPTPQETTQQPVPQPRPTSRTKAAWLWLCFQAGRHWRKLCLVTTVVLFFASGFRDSEAWTVMSVAIVLTGIVAAFSIGAGSGQSWNDKRRYIVNATTVIALFITGITAMSISTPPSPPASTAVAKWAAAVPCKKVTGEACVTSATTDTPPTTESSELVNPQPQAQNNPITATAKDSTTQSIIHSKNNSSSVADAAYIVLRSGQRLRVTGYQLLGDQFHLQMEGGWVTVSASDVLSIEPEPPTKQTEASLSKTWKNLRDGNTYRTRIDGQTLYLDSTDPDPGTSEIAGCKFHRAITIGLSWVGQCWERNPKDKSTYQADATIATFSETRIDMGTGDMNPFTMIPADGTSNTAPQNSMGVMNQVQPSSSPTMPVSHQESPSPVNGTAPAQRDMSALTGAERQSIESVCSHAKYLEGPVAYNRCLQSQLAALAATQERPDLSRLSGAEQQSIESACSHAKYLEGPAAYNRCLGGQLAALGNVSSRPDLSGLSGPEQQSIESVCSHSKYLEGPASYNQCLRNQLTALANAPRRPDLSGLSGPEQQSIESACSHAKYLEGPAAYNRCLRAQMDSLRNSR